MKYKNKYLYFILLLMKEMTSALSANGTSPLRYDITKALDHWFSKVMNFNATSATSEVLSALREAEKYHLRDYEYDLGHKVEPFSTKLFFRDVAYRMTCKYKYIEFSFSQIDWNLRANEVSLLAQQGKFGKEYDFVHMSITGNLSFAKEDPYCWFKADLSFRDFKLHTAALSNNRSMDISYDYFSVNEFEAPDTWWQYDIGNDKLIRELKPAFIAMQKEIINRHNTLFQSAFESLFNISKQANHYVSSTNGDIFQKGRKYYYLIPNFPFCCGFSLKTIVIKGLTNIKSLKFYRNPSPFSHSLSMNNVHGKMLLDYERVEEKPLKLEFKFDRFSMSIVHANNCVIVEAPGFSVNSTSGPLTRLQLTVLVPFIESAIVSSLMPSRQVCDVPEDAKILAAIKPRITKASDWNTVKEICQDWIPFSIVI